MATIRKTSLITDEIYHVFNRGIDNRLTFENDTDYLRFYMASNYYSYSSPPIRLSAYLLLGDKFKQISHEGNWGEKLVSMMAYCYMPNHFHFLLKQKIDGGISKFIGQLLNSYTRYFNVKNNRLGPLFLDDFKNVLIENENQFTHVSRYIHLNPYSAGLVKNEKELLDYRWSSLSEYLVTCSNPVCDKSMLQSIFKNKDTYKKFVFANADYQKKLKQVGHLLID